MIITIFLITVFLMMASLVFFPKIKLGKIQISSSSLIVVLGAIFMLILGIKDKKMLLDTMFSDSSMNPIKLIILFMSVTLISLFLDKVGFFKFLAHYVTKKVGGSQLKLFCYLYVLTSLLTIFTSNDVMILTFTPFVMYFAKSAKINPLPYLISILVSANTWSIMLLIGNPTNIYLGTMAGIGFMEYLKVMVIPALVAGFSGFIMVYLIFRKQLKHEMSVKEESFKIEEPHLMIIGLIHLFVCILFIALSNILKIEMWLVGLILVVSLSVFVLGYSIFVKNKSILLLDTFKKAPWSFVPMIISMFILVQGLSQSGDVLRLANILNKYDPIFSYGYSGHIIANLINNQPMSMLYSEMIVSTKQGHAAVYASIIGSNTAVLLTPFGALAGLMWFDLLKKFDYNITFKKYIAYLLPIGFVVLTLTLLTLKIVL